LTSRIHANSRFRPGDHENMKVVDEGVCCLWLHEILQSGIRLSPIS